MSRARKTDPLQETQALVDAVSEGWKVDHAEPAQVVDTSGGRSAVATMVIKPGEYRGWKRHPGGTGLVEQTGDTPEQLAARIQAWEASQLPTTEGGT